MYRLNLADWLGESLAMLPDWFVTVFISMLPLVELRGALPVAILIYKMHPATAFIISVIGNMIPIPFVMILLHRGEVWLRRYKWWDRVIDKWFDRLRNRASNTIERFEVIGLCLYVAIPLPVTGAWTGAFIAYLFDLDRRRAFLAITAGVLIAGLIVLFLSEAALWAMGG